MTESTATRVLQAWVKLEEALRAAMPVCSFQPPTQPSELLSALRINHQIGPEDEAKVLALRERRNQVAHAPEEPSEEEANRYEAEAQEILDRIGALGQTDC